MDANTKFYASQGNGGSSHVTGAQLAAFGSTNGTPATTTTYGVVKQGAAVTALTDNSGGTATDTLGAIAAGASYTQADMQAVQAAIASLGAKINAINAALVAAGVMA